MNTDLFFANEVGPVWSGDVMVAIPGNAHHLSGILNLPVTAPGVVIFAHGSGSGRFSPRNQFVAHVLNQAGLGTLLLDLLDEDEAEDREKVFDIDLLAKRLHQAAHWLHHRRETRALPLGYFGASTGAGAALVAAAQHPDQIAAVVSRGGRPDLAGEFLQSVRAPTRLIVGGADLGVLGLNQQAYQELRCPKDLVVIPGATHLFPEPDALEQVAQSARDWFRRYLRGPEAPVADELWECQ